MTPVEFRRHLHRHPELSFRETESARFIAEALREVYGDAVSVTLS